MHAMEKRVWGGKCDAMCYCCIHVNKSNKDNKVSFTQGRRALIRLYMPVFTRVLSEKEAYTLFIYARYKYYGIS